VEAEWKVSLHPWEQESYESLLEENMAPVYGKERWERVERHRKREEAADAYARFLVFRGRERGEMAAAVHCKFVGEETFAALYVYELQVAPPYRSQGKGVSAPCSPDEGRTEAKPKRKCAAWQA